MAMVSAEYSHASPWQPSEKREIRREGITKKKSHLIPNAKYR
jgi:hypothetical protein